VQDAGKPQELIMIFFCFYLCVMLQFDARFTNCLDQDIGYPRWKYLWVI